MTSLDARPKAYLKRGCPFCLKLRIFLTEAGMAEVLDYVVFEDGDETHLAVRARMERAGRQPGFPAVEFEPGRFETGADALIGRFAQQGGVDPGSLALLNYYTGGVFKAFGEMYMELKNLKSS